MNNNTLINAIKASTIHKNVGTMIREKINPNESLLNIVKMIENKVKEEVNYDINNPLNGGLAFPVGVSLNNVAAHYTPNYNEDEILFNYNDVLKIDYGVHIKGVIIDSAFTLHFNPKYDEFINLSKKLTNYAVSLCGPDVVLGDIGKDIEEYINSKSVVIDRVSYDINIMRDLCGHSISKYEIHSGKAVPNVNIDYNLRMKEYEYYAIEPFISTGNGTSILSDHNSHFMMNKNYKKKENYYNLNNDEKAVYNILDKNYYTMPFCQRWLYEYINNFNYDKILKSLENKKILQSYPAIYDIKNSIISQFEHTIYVKENGIINLTSNDFY